MDRIPVAGPWITQKEIDYVADAAAHAWYRSANLYHDRFEKAFSEFLGIRYTIALPSCTSAIHLALCALGVGRGDEVIVPEITWIATAAPVSYVGADPAFADIDGRNWCLSPASVEAAITSRTKAVLAVDLYGGMPDMDGLEEVCRSRGLALVEDAAQAIGSEYHGRKSGTFGEVGVFSFHGSKTLTTGEGGMLVTDREDVYRRCLYLRDHARAPGGRMFWNTEVAYKYKMSSMQAALGLAQLERLPELLDRKRQIFGWYREELAALERVSLNEDLPSVDHTYWMVTVLLDPSLGLTKEEVILKMSELGVDCRPFFYPLSSLPAYKDAPWARDAARRNPVSYRLSPYGINLPSSLTLTREQVVRVCRALRRCLEAGSA